MLRQRRVRRVVKAVGIVAVVVAVLLGLGAIVLSMGRQAQVAPPGAGGDASPPPPPPSGGTRHPPRVALRPPLPSGGPRTTRLDGILNTLPWGSLAFHAPSTIGYGKAEVVHLALSGAKSPSQLEQLVRQKGGVTEGHRLRIAETMQAHLTGDGFQITPITPEVQTASTAETTEWKWEIRPKEFGRQSLHLSVDALVVLDGKDRPHSLRTFDRIIVVKVTWPQTIYIFLRGNWQWAWSVIVVPLAAWLLRRWQIRRRQSRE